MLSGNTTEEADYFLGKRQVRLVLDVTDIKNALRSANGPGPQILTASLVEQIKRLLDCTLEFCSLLEKARKEIENEDYDLAIDILGIELNASTLNSKQGMLLSQLVFRRAEKEAAAKLRSFSTLTR